MAAAGIPPAVHTTLSGAQLGAQPASRRERRRQLTGWITTKGCAHALKLRHSFKVDSHTRLEVGLDFDVLEDHAPRQMLHSAAPWAAMLYRFDENDEHKGAIEMTPQWLSYNRRYRIGPEGAWWAVPFDAKLGLTYSGSPHVEVGLLNVPLALVLGAGLLYAGAPIGIKRKEVGGLAVHFPLGSGSHRRDYSLQERVELDATLQREGRGLKLEFQRINGVLRLRQDD